MVCVSNILCKSSVDSSCLKLPCVGIEVPSGKLPSLRIFQSFPTILYQLSVLFFYYQDKMTTVVCSQLNPLANAFIPTNTDFFSSKAIQHAIESENETKTTWEGKGKLNSNDLKSEYKTTQGTTIKVDYKYLLLKETILSVTSELNVLLTNSSMGQSGLQKLGDSQLPMLPECLTDYDQKLVRKSKPDSTSKTLAEEKDECNCPPMFGWIMPPDFIGNPFNFKYECGKKYPHSPDCTVKRESDFDTLDYVNTEINQWTLDECLSEMKDILADVCETISDSDPVRKWDEKYKISDYLEMSDIDSDVESKDLNDFGTEFASLTEIEPDLVDDGVHPLLQSGPTAYEDEKDSIENIEKILGRSLSSSLPEYLDVQTFAVGAVCNPPCSIWCESLPSAARDAFRKYVQKSENTDHKECPRRSGIGCRPVFKRSLSADDAPMYGHICSGLNPTSEKESREMLLLRRQNPLNYFSTRSSDTLTKGKKYGSCDFTDQQLLARSTESNMWGKFDGADSLWQPLPECNVVNGHNPKLNLKKGRETRRQRTMS